MSLPSGYTRVEYIQSSGTQYIDTGISCTSGIGIELVGAYDSSSDYNVMLGATKPSYQTDIMVQSNSITIRMAEGNVLGYTYDTNYHTYTVDGNNVYYDGALVDVIGSAFSELNIYLFGDTYSSWRGSCRIKSCKLSNNSTIVRNFVPCIRTSDNAVGMYDTVNNVFYTNEGTGTFTAGEQCINNSIEFYIKANNAWTQVI